jgi:lipopolysaccharide transport system ATP-binding protein
MSDIAIQAENVSKSYWLGHRTREAERYIALRDVIAAGARELARKTVDMIAGRPMVQGDHVEEFWALRDVSFQIRVGETVGIIGRNGAGKSTLLKILSRITEPTQGRIKIHGRVASLLEVGTGFHPELSGRENVFLNGAILGMTRREIQRKFDEIVAFAGVNNFIDTPVKRYSSGMYVRLAFAVAAHLDPEILVVDEVLAVGDAAFQRKCLGKMQEIGRSGRTVLFVSHNIAAINTLCSSAILLESGRVKQRGPTSDVVAAYSEKDPTLIHVDLHERRDRSGNGKLRFSEIELLDLQQRPVRTVMSGSPLVLRAAYRTDSSGGDMDPDKLIVSFGFYDINGTLAALFSSDEMGPVFHQLRSDGAFHLEIPRLLLRGGTYSVRLAAAYQNTAPENLLDVIDDAAVIEVVAGDFWNVGRPNRAGTYPVMDATLAHSA